VVDQKKWRFVELESQTPGERRYKAEAEP
jgi:hypothetical protein